MFDAFADSYAKEQTRSIEGRRLTATTTYVYCAFTCFNGMHCECKHTCKERVDQLYYDYDLYDMSEHCHWEKMSLHFNFCHKSFTNVP